MASGLTSSFTKNTRMTLLNHEKNMAAYQEVARAFLGDAYHEKEEEEGKKKKKPWGVATFAKGHSGTCKILHYDIEKLVSRGSLFSSFTKGTVFNMDAIVWLTILNSFGVSLVAGLLMWNLADTDMGEIDLGGLESLVTYVNGLCPFVLGLYISLVLNRWWALRTAALGSVFDALSNTCMLVGVTLHGEKYHDFRVKILKLGLASVKLLLKAARDDAEMGSFVENGLLTVKEIAHLEQAPKWQKPMMCWFWILRLTDAAILGLDLPPPWRAARANAIAAECKAARSGIQLINTYLNTQLPFAYVHLITLLVNLNNLIVAVLCGCRIARSSHNGKWSELVWEISRMVIVPTLYQGLLNISYMIHDPFGNDVLDFPVVAYAKYVSDSCSVAFCAQEWVPDVSELVQPDQVQPEVPEEPKASPVISEVGPTIGAALTPTPVSLSPPTVGASPDDIPNAAVQPELLRIGRDIVDHLEQITSNFDRLRGAVVKSTPATERAPASFKWSCSSAGDAKPSPREEAVWFSTEETASVQ